jgi:hypothetical protein
MNLYFQVFTQSQTVDALELLRFLRVFAQEREIKGKVSVSSGGKISRYSFSNYEKLVSKVSGKRFNQFEAKVDPKAFDLAFGDSIIASVNAVFTPASSGDLWFSYRDWPPGGERSERLRRMNAKMREEGLRYYGVSKPNLVEIVFAIESASSKDVVLGAVAKRIAAQTSVEFLQIEPFGCCDVGGPEFFVRMEAGVLMTDGIRVMAELMPPMYPELGARFDKLHPLMFGDKRLCSKIGKALGSDAEVICGDRKRGLGVVRLNSDCDLALGAERASKLLLYLENREEIIRIGRSRVVVTNAVRKSTKQ